MFGIIVWPDNDVDGLQIGNEVVDLCKLSIGDQFDNYAMAIPATYLNANSIREAVDAEKLVPINKQQTAVAILRGKSRFIFSEYLLVIALCVLLTGRTVPRFEPFGV